MAHSPLCYKTRHRSAKRNHRYQISDIIIYRVTSSTRKTCVCKAASCGAPSRSERAPSGAHGGRMPTTSLLTRYSMYGFGLAHVLISFQKPTKKRHIPHKLGARTKSSHFPHCILSGYHFFFLNTQGTNTHIMTHLHTLQFPTRKATQRRRTGRKVQFNSRRSAPTPLQAIKGQSTSSSCEPPSDTTFTP